MSLFSKIRNDVSSAAIAAMFTATTTLFSFPALANIGDSDPMIEGAKLCTRYLPRHEREYGIPVHLLAAIASTESGRYHKGLGLTIPWPWTINAEGKGYFFDSKQEAIAAVQKLQASGVQSIDVGCMQVNLKHHPDAFASLSDAFDPRYNVAYAAHFLRSNYDDLGNWRSAAAAYHSRTPDFGNRYVYNVYTRWNQILTKIAEAKGGKPATQANFASAQSADAPLSRGDMSSNLKESRGTEKQAFSPKASTAASQKYARKPIRMRVIELAKRDRSKENGVIIIRPESEEQQIASIEPTVKLGASQALARTTTGAQTEDAAAAELAGAEPAAGQFDPQSAKLIRVNRSGKSTDASAASASQFQPRKTPQFVFDN